jgi:hypothetical protein
MKGDRIMQSLRTVMFVILVTGVVLGCDRGIIRAPDEPESPPVVPPVVEGDAGPLRKVLVEIDQMEGTTPLTDRQTIAGREISLAGIYLPGGLQLRVVRDALNLPRAPTVSEADLHALMTTNANVPVESGESKIYVLVVTQDLEYPETLGLMFDFGAFDTNGIPRESFAIFEKPHESLAGGVVREMLLTAAHEMAHCYNLHHTDWEGTGFEEDCTVEGYSLSNTVRWSLSQRSVAHLRTHARSEVWPGEGSLPFGMISLAHSDGHQRFPRENYEVIDESRVARTRRAEKVDRAAVVKQLLARSDGSLVATDSETLKLEVRSPKANYVVGEAVTLTVALRNDGTSARQVPGELAPEFGVLNVAIQEPGDDTPRPFRPAILRDTRRIVRRTLPPRQSLLAEARIFFGAEGWTLTTPGEYVVFADYPVSVSANALRVQSAPLRFTVTDGESASSAHARRLLTDPETARLGTEQGLFLLFRGGDHLKKGGQAIRRIAAEAPDSPQATTSFLALSKNALQPTVDPATHEKPRPNLDDAVHFAGEIDAEKLPKASAEDLEDALKREFKAQRKPLDSKRLGIDELFDK